MIRYLAAFLFLLALPAQAQDFTGRFTLDDHDGRRVTEQSFAGKIRVVSFGYTFCPDICPTTLATIAAALDLLGPTAQEVVPLFITVDPKRDTPAHLKDYLSAFGPRFIGLTGTREQVADAAFQFQARYRIHRTKDSETYFMDHTAWIYVLDRQGGLAAKLGHEVSAGELAGALREALAARLPGSSSRP